MREFKEFKGYPLFDDIEDFQLRNKNRAAVMANMLQEHAVNGLIMPKGVSLMIGYFKEVIPLERKACKEALEAELQKRGVKYAS